MNKSKLSKEYSQHVSLVFLLSVFVCSNLFSATIYKKNFNDQVPLNTLKSMGWALNSKNIRYDVADNTRYIQFGSTKVASNSVFTPYIAIDGHNLLRISSDFQVYAVRLGSKHWHLPRIQVYFYDVNKKFINNSSYTVFTTRESTQLQNFSKIILTDPRAKFLRIAYELKYSYGFFRLKNIAINLVKNNFPINEIKALENYQDRMLPSPKYVVNGNDTAQFSNINIITQTASKRLLDYIESKEASVNFPISYSNDLINSVLNIKFLSQTETLAVETMAALAAKGHPSKLATKQTYLLVNLQSNSTPTVYIIAKSDMGHYYGLQTLFNYLNNQGSEKQLEFQYIYDFPKIDKRGIVMNDLREWYYGIPVFRDGKYTYVESERPSYKQLMQKNKLNFIWLTRWQGFNSRNILPISKADIDELTAFYSSTKQSFVDVSVGFKPHKQTPYFRRALGGIMYSAQQDVELLINNYKRLYEIGYRHFHIAFDDIVYDELLQYRNDKILYTTAAQAHQILAKKIYDELKALDPKIKFRVLGSVYKFNYYSPKFNSHYLETMSKLPNDVDYIFIPDTNESILQLRKLLGANRAIGFWSNFYQVSQQKYDGTGLVYPFYGARKPSKVNLVLLNPVREVYVDYFKVGWVSFAEHAWQGGEYNTSKVFSSAILNQVGDGVFQGFLESLQRVRLSAAPVADDTGSGQYMDDIIIDSRNYRAWQLERQRRSRFNRQGLLLEQIVMKCRQNIRCRY